MNAPALNMALGQLITNRVVDQALLDAFTATPREKFVPAALAGAAYVDEDLPVGKGRFLPAPLPLAQMIQLAEVSAEDRALVIGCGTGYAVAVLAALAKEATGCDTEEELIATAKKNLAALGLANAKAEKTAALAEGCPGGPYGVILLQGTVECVPDSLIRQLPPGGRLVAPLRITQPNGLAQGLARLTLFANLDGDIFRKESVEISLPALPGFEANKTFEF